MSVEQLSPPTENKREELMAGLFRDLQIARYNELYFQMRAGSLRTRSNSAKILAAVTSSAVLVGLVSSQPAGPLFLQALTGLTALFAAVEFVLHWDADASRFEKASLGYSFVRDRSKALLRDLKCDDLQDTHLARATEIEAISNALTALNDAGVPAVKEAAWKQTMEEFPSDQAWNLV